MKLTEAMETADQSYTETCARVDGEMRSKADSVATNISSQLAMTDQSVEQRRAESAAKRYAQLEHLAHRLKQGVSRGLHRIAITDDRVQQRFPDWGEVLSEGPSEESNVDFLPLGALRVEDSLRQLLKAEVSQSKSSVGGNGAMILDIQGWLDNPISNYGWVLLGDEASPTTSRRFDSREGGAQPTLTIDFTPFGDVEACCQADGDCSLTIVGSGDCKGTPLLGVDSCEVQEAQALSALATGRDDQQHAWQDQERHEQ